MKNKPVVVQISILDVFNTITMGRIKAISTSKIRKIIAIIKNRIEKGIREEFMGSKPHSNGDDFSRSVVVFLDKKEAKIITTDAINMTIVPMITIEKITYTKIFLVLLIGSQIY